MEQEINKLKHYFSEGDQYVLLFSGGFDSSALLGVTRDMNVNLLPVWVNNGLNRAYSEEISQQAKELDAGHLKEINIDLPENVSANPHDRCYLCKSDLLSFMDSEAQIIDGTVTDDLDKYRPGLQALKENQVRSLLAEAGIDKAKARQIALYYGADEQIAKMESCLATRVNYHVPLNMEVLESIRQIERFVIEQTGDYNVRCRVDSRELVRIELSSPNSCHQLVDVKDQIIEKGKAIGNFVTLDLEPSRPNEHDKKLRS